MTARWNQRGVAYWTDGRAERVFWGTGDGYLVAVDATTGIPVESFGDRGRVDLMRELPYAVRGSRDWLNALTAIGRARQSHRHGSRLGRSAGDRNRHANDLHDRRQAVHCPDRQRRSGSTA